MSERTRKLRALHSNGCCLQSHLLATGPCVTVYCNSFLLKYSFYIIFSTTFENNLNIIIIRFWSREFSCQYSIHKDLHISFRKWASSQTIKVACHSISYIQITLFSSNFNTDYKFLYNWVKMLLKQVIRWYFHFFLMVITCLVIWKVSLFDYWHT
jgi:hypothetical protein